MNRFLFLIILSFSLLHCERNEQSIPLAPEADRGLRIHVIKRNLQTLEEIDVNNATVKVFDSAQNWNNNIGSIFTLTTDSNGVVLFGFLHADSHFVQVGHIDYGIITGEFRTPVGTISIEDMVYHH